MSLPAWSDTAIWYAIYPLGFTDAPSVHSVDETQTVPRLRRIIGWLDHIIALGCNGILLGPIFSSASHGYDTCDHFTIDKRLGDEPDFDALVQACHSRGIRLVLDGVFNHVGEDHPFVASAVADKASEYNDWFFITREGDRVHWLNFEGSNNLVRLNHDHPPVVDYIEKVMDYWLSKGADGWRLDAAYAVKPEIWAELERRLRPRHEQMLTIAEVIHRQDGWCETSHLNSITAYEMWKAIWSSIADCNFFELEWSIQRHRELASIIRPLTFISNHDVTRIATTVSLKGAALAAAIMMTLPGMPALYYGDEGGVQGTKYEREGGDDEIRRPLAESPEKWQMPYETMMGIYQSLIGIRRRHPWLVDADIFTCELRNEYIRYRLSGDGEWMEVALSLGECHQIVITDATGEIYRLDIAD